SQRKPTWSCTIPWTVLWERPCSTERRVKRAAGGAAASGTAHAEMHPASAPAWRNQACGALRPLEPTLAKTVRPGPQPGQVPSVQMAPLHRLRPHDERLVHRLGAVRGGEQARLLVDLLEDDVGGGDRE